MYKKLANMYLLPCIKKVSYKNMRSVNYVSHPLLSYNVGVVPNSSIKSVFKQNFYLNDVDHGTVKIAKNGLSWWEPGISL